MKGLSQDVEIALVELPSGVADVDSFDGGDFFAFHRTALPSFDESKEGGAEADIGNSVDVLWPVRQKTRFVQVKGRLGPMYIVRCLETWLV